LTEEVVFARRASGLVRELTIQDVIIWGVAAPAASGINFFSVRMAYTYPGSNAALSFLISSLILLPLAVTLAMMSAAMPRAGGMYVHVSRVINPTIGFWASWVMVIGYGIAIGLLGHIVTGLFGGALIMAGLGGAGLALVEAGKALGTNVWRSVGGVVFTLFFWVITLYSVKTVKWITRVIFYLPAIATAIAAITFLVVGPGGAPSAFNQMWGAGAYQKILDAARANGWGFPGFSMDATIASLVYPFWAWTAFEAISFAAGEVKSPRRSMLVGFNGGFIACMLTYVFVAWAVYYPYGDFIGAYVFLANKAPDALSAIMPVITPSVPFFAASLMGNVWLGVIVSLLMCLHFADSILPIFVATTRVLFGLAFDRAIPEKFSGVNKRGSPTWAAHVTMIWGLVGVVITAVPGVDIILGILDFTMLNFFWLLGFAALLLPYLKPEIFKRSPVQWTIGGIPVISLLGLYTLAAGFWIVCFSILEFTYAVAVVMSFFIAIGFIVYAWKQAQNVKAGIDISKIYVEIPPE